MVVAFVAFAATTIDDLIIVTALFTSSRTTGLPRPISIVVGQYVGFSTVVAFSLIAAMGLHGISDQWVGLLGLIPIAFGVRGLWRLSSSRGRTDEGGRLPLAAGVPGIAAITFANGADTFGVFTPLFRTMHPIATLLTATGFVALAGVWCALGALLGTRRTVIATVGKIDYWLVPLVFITIGVLIMASTGTFGAVADTVIR